MLSMCAWFQKKVPRRRKAVLHSRAERSQPSSPRTASKASEPDSQGSPDATSSVPEPADATTIAPLATAADLGVSEEKLKQWRKLGGGDLEPVLASGAVALLDAQWIVDHAAGGILKHRQALPEEAFLSLSDLVEATHSNPDALPVAALSYPWLTKEHPDPEGANLRRVARVLKSMLSSGSQKGSDYGYPYIPRIGVFWDYVSLHQHPDPANGIVRSEAENALFVQGLGCLGMLYSHPLTWVLRLTTFPAGYKKEDQPEGTNVSDYFDRGWCATESSWSSLTKPSDMSLNLGQMRDDTEYDSFFSIKGIVGLAEVCTRGGGRRPPLMPSQFAAELEKKTFTNGKDDKPLVKRLYDSAFSEQFGKVIRLDYGNLGWGATEVEQLTELIVSGATPQLEALRLSYNDFGDEGLKALVAGLGKEGAAPRLKSLSISECQIGEEGWKVLSAALKEGAFPSLKDIYLDCKDIYVQEHCLSRYLCAEASLKPTELAVVCAERGIELDF